MSNRLEKIRELFVEALERDGLDAQLKECMEYLENPEVLITEFLEHGNGAGPDVNGDAEIRWRGGLR